MSRDEIQDRVLKILNGFAGRGAKLAELNESTTLEQLEVNSARMIDIVIELEDQFKVTIDDSNSPKLKTVNDIVSLVDGLVNV
jgi:acyl carrier protein